jgi:protein FAM50
MPKLSFGLDNGGDDDEADTGLGRGLDNDAAPAASTTPTPALTPTSRSQTSSPAPAGPKKAKVAPNASVAVLPRAQTKRTLLEESRAREALRKEFLALQERVKTAEMAIPFVFYDGGNIPGGVVRVKKGDFVWVFLDGSRKVGAGLGVGSKEGEGAKARREWARVGVDDLMLVRGEIIIPHVSDYHPRKASL